MKSLLVKDYNTDKTSNYLRNYESHFGELVDKNVKLLELGIHYGGSLQMWRDYFENGLIIGIDLKPVTIEDSTGRIKCFQGCQEDIGFLKKVAAQYAPDGFDIIIDDCSHIGKLTRTSFWFLFDNHLKKGGIYVIEDWGTGYWDSWPDGRSIQKKKIDDEHRIPSHDYGMVGFIKELIDECGMGDITHKKFGKPPTKTSRIEKMFISPGIVFIIKA